MDAINCTVDLSSSSVQICAHGSKLPKTVAMKRQTKSKEKAIVDCMEISLKIPFWKD